MFKAILATTVGLVSANQQYPFESVFTDTNLEIMEDYKSTYMMAKENAKESPLLQQSYTGTPYDTAKFWAFSDFTIGTIVGLYMPIVRLERHADCFSYWFSTLINTMSNHKYFDQAYTMSIFSLTVTLGNTGFQWYKTVKVCIDQFANQERQGWFDVYERGDKINKEKKKAAKEAKKDGKAPGPNAPSNSTVSDDSAAPKDAQKGGPQQPAQSLLVVPQDVFGFTTLSGGMNDPSFKMVLTQAISCGTGLYNMYKDRNSKLWWFERGYQVGAEFGNLVILAHYWTGSVPTLYAVKPWIRYQALLPPDAFVDPDQPNLPPKKEKKK